MSRDREQFEADRKARYLETCRHFTGIQNAKCKVGIAYEAIGYAATGMCLACVPGGTQDRPRGECSRFESHTEVDWEARQAEIEASMERHRKAAPALSKIRQEYKGRSGSGTIPCPACGTGTLHWSISGYNGHMHGRCTTVGCLNWME